MNCIEPFGRRTRVLGWMAMVASLTGCSGSETERAGEAFQPVIPPDLEGTVAKTSSWGTGYCADVSIKNMGGVRASSWLVVLDLHDATIYTSWNGVFTSFGSRKIVTPYGWNAIVNPGATQTFGYCANLKPNGKSFEPTIISPRAKSGTNAGSGGAGGIAGNGVGGASGTAGLGGGEAVGVAGAGGSAEVGGGGAVGAGGIAGTGGGPAGYAVTSEYLLYPDRSIAVLRSLADFRVKARDNLHGGFFTYVNPDGAVSANRKKSFVTQSRDAWAFARAFMVTGDETYLDHAAHALEYLYSHGWDNARGGWYFTSDEWGNIPVSYGWDPNTFKWSFVQHYALLGMGALCEASRDALACSWLQKGRDFLDARMWDSHPAHLGYYEQANLDLSNPRGKGFTATVDALTTNAIQTELLWPTAANHQRIVDLANITADRLAANMDLSSARFGFPESYDANWNVDTAQTDGYVGHVLKAAWVLARVYLRHQDARYREAARKLIYEVLNNGGWDEANGVPYAKTRWTSGPLNRNETECWQIEQAITGGLSNWYIAEDQADRDAFLRMADRSLRFFANYVIDPTNGGTYLMNTVSGAPQNAGKSDEYKVEYHSSETFYFTYLYGNLMLRRSPVQLYYMVAPSPTQQSIRLNPVAIDDASLQIESATLNGAPLQSFSGPSREITLAANQGGKLRVVFGPSR